MGKAKKEKKAIGLAGCSEVCQCGQLENLRVAAQTERLK